VLRNLRQRLSERRAYAAFARHHPAATELHLHLGCGRVLLPGWVNVDQNPRPGTLTMRLPEGLRRFGDGCARYIYASHVLEHLMYPDDAQRFACECHRLLVPGGVLRVVVPGVEKILRAYVDGNRAFFEIQAGLHPAWCTTDLEHLMYALQQDGQHKYGYDFETLEKLLLGAQFSDVRPSDYNASEIEDLRVDYRGIRDDAGEYLSLFAEAVR
jgi:predicted SAM-dependent methyltransferase